MANQQMPMASFRASTHQYLEKFNTSSVIAMTTSTVDASPPANSVQSYGFLRAINIRMRNSVAASTGGTLSTDAPANFLNTLRLTDPNGAEIYGGPTWGGYETYLAEKYGTYKNNNAPETSTFASFTTTAPTWLWKIPLELSEASGYGALPNFDAQSPYKLTSVVNTVANSYQTAPTTTNPSILLDYIIDCWTYPDAINKLSGIHQSQFPPGIGAMSFGGNTDIGCTVQHWTKSNPSITANSAVTASLIRKGNTYRNLVMAVRNSSGVRQATTNFPNPLTFALDGAPLWNNIDPAFVVEEFWRRESSSSIPGATAGTASNILDTGVVPVIFGCITADNNAGSDGTLGSQGWLGNNQASRIEFSGTWGANASTLDVLTNDVNAVSLEGSSYAYSFGNQLAAASLPSVRSGS